MKRYTYINYIFIYHIVHHVIMALSDVEQEMRKCFA